MNKKQELLNYVSRLIDHIDLKGNRDDLVELQKLLFIDNTFSHQEPQPYGESLVNLIKK